MKKYSFIMAIILLSSTALFADYYTVTYNVTGGYDEVFTFGRNMFNPSQGSYQIEESLIIPSNNYSWTRSYYYDPNGPPPVNVIISFFLTRNLTGYTITKENDGNVIIIMHIPSFELPPESYND